MTPATDKQLADFVRAYGDLILEALDSHLYWQLCEDPTRRSDGYVLEPYTEAEQHVVDTEAHLRKLLHPHGEPTDALDGWLARARDYLTTDKDDLPADIVHGLYNALTGESLPHPYENKEV